MARRAVRAKLIIPVVLAFAGLATPSETAACSCVPPADIIDSAGREPGSAVFTATAGPRVGNDIPVIVTRWLAGLPPAGAIVLRGTDPNDMCGPTTPPAGGEYLFVTYQDETGRFNINGCSVQADVTTPEGQALLARAISRFGPGFAPDPAPPGPDPTTDPPELRPGLDIATIATGIVGGLGPIVLVVAFGIGLVAAIVGVLKRTRLGRG